MEAKDFKHFECPNCKNISIYSDWNDYTESGLELGSDELYGIETEDKDECFYICPKCKKESIGDLIKEYVVEF